MMQTMRAVSGAGCNLSPAPRARSATVRALGHASLSVDGPHGLPALVGLTSTGSPPDSSSSASSASARASLVTLAAQAEPALLAGKASAVPQAATGRATEVASSLSGPALPSFGAGSLRAGAGVLQAPDSSPSTDPAGASLRATTPLARSLCRLTASASSGAPDVAASTCGDSSLARAPERPSSSSARSWSSASRIPSTLARVVLVAGAHPCASESTEDVCRSRAPTWGASPLPRPRSRAAAAAGASVAAPTLEPAASPTRATCEREPEAADADGCIEALPCRAETSLVPLPATVDSRAGLDRAAEGALPAALPARSAARVAVTGSALGLPAAYLVQPLAGRSRSDLRSAVAPDDPTRALRSTAPARSRGYLHAPNVPRGSATARTPSSASLRLDTYAARTPLLYNACLAGVASASTARITHPIKLYRAVARAVSVAQAVDRIVPVDPLLSVHGRTTAPSVATDSAHRERTWAMFLAAHRAAAEGEYDVERLAARVARDYLEQSIAPARALLEELRARAVDEPAIGRLIAPPIAPVRTPTAQAQLDKKRAERKRKKTLDRTQAPYKLIGRRYVVGSARVTVTGYDARSGRWECTTEDGDVVSYSLSELSG